ncbi:TIR domain-containing protein [Exiguobacterium sp. s91]|uniref:TIR domain-containing protein n=1 Tax=Exiguobacterium sp. s91 TaxID=2751199 RepID=UPI003336AE9A
MQYRARKNVIFELGFFYGKLGRSNVCCLLKQSVEKSSDLDGIAYIPFTESIDEIEYDTLKELRESNLKVKI